MAIQLLTQSIRREALRLGFDHCRIVPVGQAAHADFFDAWIAADRAGEMRYLARNTDKRREPARLLEKEQARSIIVLGVNHFQFQLPPKLRDDPGRGVVASYAWGDDYHEIIRPLLYDLDAFIRQQTGRSEAGKCLVDTGPVLERDWAHSSGLGFTGKNCCTIHPRDGSWLLLATVIVPEQLAFDTGLTTADEPPVETLLSGLAATERGREWQIPLRGADSATGTCGRCTRCIDLCPTNAFVGAYHLDPERCISYWTIEASAPIPPALRPAFANRIFGCDICQEVCPWNTRLAARTPLLKGLRAQQARIAIPLLEGFDPATPYWLDQTAFSTRFRRSPIKRAKRRGMLRNVCVALGNWADVAVVDALALALQDPEPLARGHAAWALGQVRDRRAGKHLATLLRSAQSREGHSWVREELSLALSQL